MLKTHVCTHAEIPGHLLRSSPGALMSLLSETGNDCTTQGEVACLCAAFICVSVCVGETPQCVLMCVQRGRTSEITGNDHKLLRSLIWGLGPAWNAEISPLPWRWTNLPPLSGSGSSPWGSVQKSVCGQHVFTVIRPRLQVCVHTRKSVKTGEDYNFSLCYRKLVQPLDQRAWKRKSPPFLGKIISKLHI